MGRKYHYIHTYTPMDLFAYPSFIQVFAMFRSLIIEWTPTMTISSICLSIQSMLSSCKKKVVSRSDTNSDNRSHHLMTRIWKKLPKGKVQKILLGMMNYLLWFSLLFLCFAFAFALLYFIRDMNMALITNNRDFHDTKA